MLFAKSVSLSDSASALFSGKEFIQYEVKDSSIGGSTGSTGRVSRRQLDPLQSFIELEISLSFRTKIQSGIILEMTGPPQSDFAIIQVCNHSETMLLQFMMILLKTLSISLQLS